MCHISSLSIRSVPRSILSNVFYFMCAPVAALCLFLCVVWVCILKSMMQYTRIRVMHTIDIIETVRCTYAFSCWFLSFFGLLIVHAMPNVIYGYAARAGYEQYRGKNPASHTGAKQFHWMRKSKIVSIDLCVCVLHFNTHELGFGGPN